MRCFREDIQFNTDRLTLRPLTSRDLLTAHKYASDVDVTKYMINLPNHSIVDTLEFLLWCEDEWEKDIPTDYEFAICLNDKHIGSISLSQVDDFCYEFGWILDKDYQGNGYATEAARELTRFAKSLGANKLIAHCDTRNVASRRVMEKLGMTLVLEQERKYLDERGVACEYEFAMRI